MIRNTIIFVIKTAQLNRDNVPKYSIEFVSSSHFVAVSPIPKWYFEDEWADRKVCPEHDPRFHYEKGEMFILEAMFLGSRSCSLVIFPE